MPTKPVSKKTPTSKKTTTAKTTVKKAPSSAKTKASAKTTTPKAKATAAKKVAEKEIPKKELEKKIEPTKVEQKTAPVAQQKPTTAPQQKANVAATSPKDEQAKEDELFGSLEEPQEPQGQAEVYDELIARETEREIIRSQRKQMAGKDTKRDARKYVPQQKTGPILDRVIEIPEVISVKEFAEKTGLGAAKVIGELMKNGVLANINQQIDYDTAQIIADDFHVKIKKKVTAASA
ncbi:translation initiation factor IF-2 N-terminal domain-containing protein, partial [Candidatus Peregrinibacteria bacterium]|nr:translation initiation factor IF-2 N-terminal domain-containing protein [Candidatus Peregrinibacteria bacterium]